MLKDKENIVSESIDAESTLKVGITFRNFKEACIKVGLIPFDAATPKGNTKKRYEKELATLCKYHKEGQKIIVDEVYEKQLEKQDKRRNKSIYVDSIKTIILYLLKELDNEVYFSINELIKVLEIFNQDYYELKNAESYLEVSALIGIDLYTLKSFMVGSRRELQRIIERALKSMKSQRIIDYVEGRMIVTNEHICRIATSEEMRKIKQIEKEELIKIKCYNMATMKLKKLESKFYHKLKYRFRKEGLGHINYTFHGYIIVSYDKATAEDIEIVDKEINVQEFKKLFKCRLMQFAEGNNKRAIKKEYYKLEFGEPILELNPIASSNYISDFKRAIENFI